MLTNVLSSLLLWDMWVYQPMTWQLTIGASSLVQITKLVAPGSMRRSSAAKSALTKPNNADNVLVYTKQQNSSGRWNAARVLLLTNNPWQTFWVFQFSSWRVCLVRQQSASVLVVDSASTAVVRSTTALCHTPDVGRWWWHLRCILSVQTSGHRRTVPTDPRWLTLVVGGRSMSRHWTDTWRRSRLDSERLSWRWRFSDSVVNDTASTSSAATVHGTTSAHPQ